MLCLRLCVLARVDRAEHHAGDLLEQPPDLVDASCVITRHATEYSSDGQQGASACAAPCAAGRAGVAGGFPRPTCRRPPGCVSQD